MTPVAYLYSRWSTGRQEAGDSRRRQLRAALEWCERKGVSVADERMMEDNGVSAFRGRNAERGALGDFLDAMRAGLIPKGSYLLVENVDRLSRQKARASLRLLEEIVESGIVVVTLYNGKEWTPKALDEGFGLVEVLFSMIRAHEESLVKSVRIKAGMARVRETGRTRSGRPIGRPKGWRRKQPEAQA